MTNDILIKPFFAKKYHLVKPFFKFSRRRCFQNKSSHQFWSCQHVQTRYANLASIWGQIWWKYLNLKLQNWIIKSITY